FKSLDQRDRPCSIKPLARSAKPQHASKRFAPVTTIVRHPLRARRGHLVISAVRIARATATMLAIARERLEGCPCADATFFATSLALPLPPPQLRSCRVGRGRRRRPRPVGHPRTSPSWCRSRPAV